MQELTVLTIEMAEPSSQKKTFLYLIGKTGTGKSSTGNTILGPGQRVFKASSDSTSTANHIHREQTRLGDWHVEVVDGPGLIRVDATGFSHHQWKKYKQVCIENPDAGHVFLMVCRYGERFTAEDCTMVNELRKDFGQDLFWKHGIVLVTCGDNFKADFEGEGMSFESWCRGQGGDFGRLVADCDHRVLLVDNSVRAARSVNLLSELQALMPSLDHGYAPLDFVSKKGNIGNRVQFYWHGLLRLWEQRHHLGALLRRYKRISISVGIGIGIIISITVLYRSRTQNKIAQDTTLTFDLKTTTKL